MRRKLIIALTALLMLGFVGCGDSSEVGDESLLDFEQRQQDRLGAATPTPKVTKAPSAGSAPKTTPQPQPQATAAPQQAAITITINSDASANKFDPPLARVSKGSIIKFTNKDSKNRSIVSDKDGSFASGDIKPGGSWEYTANTAGTFSYHDGTRPYAVGKFEVT